MTDQLNETILVFVLYVGEMITESVTSPAQNHLRIVNKECEN